MSNNAERISALREKKENKRCFDCGARDNSWASASYGIWLCIKCAGIHRSWGTHISFVRSATLDTWSEKNLIKMEQGGNQKALEYFRSQGIMDLGMKEKYQTLAAKRYKAQLEEIASRILGESPKIPKQLPAPPAAVVVRTNSGPDDFFQSGGHESEEEFAWTNEADSRSSLRKNFYRVRKSRSNPISIKKQQSIEAPGKKVQTGARTNGSDRRTRGSSANTSTTMSMRESTRSHSEEVKWEAIKETVNANLEKGIEWLSEFSNKTKTWIRNNYDDYLDRPPEAKASTSPHHADRESFGVHHMVDVSAVKEKIVTTISNVIPKAPGRVEEVEEEIIEYGAIGNDDDDSWGDEWEF